MEPVATITGGAVLATVEAFLVVAGELLKKSPTYTEKIRKEYYELEGQYFSVKTMLRTDNRFWAEKIVKLKVQKDSFQINLAKEIQDAAKNSTSHS